MHGFVGQRYAAFGRQLFNVPVAEAEAEIRSDAVADDFGRKAMIFVVMGR